MVCLSLQIQSNFINLLGFNSGYMVKSLITTYGASNLNVKDKFGETPLHYVAENGNFDEKKKTLISNFNRANLHEIIR